jgi:SAM-dependent methyltransferase
MNTSLRKFSRKLTVALLHPGYHTAGSCNICNRRTLFICDVASDRWIRRCCRCRSTPKYRAIVSVIEAEIGERITHYIRSHRIYELSTTSPIFRLLRGHNNYEASGYFSDKPFGEKLSPFYSNQDLQNLTFPSGSFDAVISSETMEHIRRPWQGFAQVYRVLKPGGFYIFTIPFRDDRLTRPRVDTAGEQDIFLLEKMYHQDPYRPEDSLVYTDFGADLPELLRPIGFDTKLVRVLDERSDIQDDLRPIVVFVARKGTGGSEIGIPQH